MSTLKGELRLKNLTEGNIYKNFILFAFPMILAGLFSQMYNTIDTVVVGRFLGSDGLAALGASADLLTFVSAVFWGYSNGASLFAARCFGSKDYTKLRRIIRGNVLVNLVGATLLAIVLSACAEPILDMLKVDTGIRKDTKIYMMIYIWGIGLITLHTTFVHTMQAIGNGKFQFLMSMLSAVLNVSGNIFTVTVLHWGVGGVALSTVFAALVVDVCFTLKLKQCFKVLNLPPERFKFDPKGICEPFADGGMNMLQQMVLYLSSLIVSPIINGLGSSATAGYVIAKRVYNINTGIYQNSAKTVSNYTAQCVGAGKGKRVKKGLRVGWLQGILFYVPIMILCVIFSEKVCGFFLSDRNDNTALQYGILFVHVFLPFTLSDMLNNLFHAFFRGTTAMNLLLASSVIGSVSHVVLTYLLRGMGMQGIYIAWVCSWFFESAFALTAYLTGRWKKHPVFQNQNGKLKSSKVC